MPKPTSKSCAPLWLSCASTTSFTAPPGVLSKYPCCVPAIRKAGKRSWIVTAASVKAYAAQLMGVLA